MTDETRQAAGEMARPLGLIDPLDYSAGAFDRVSAQHRTSWWVSRCALIGRWIRLIFSGLMGKNK
jgi:hypothetical protein